MAILVRRDAREGRARHVHAVVGTVAGDDPTAVGLALEPPIAAHHLHGRIDRITATGGEEDLAVVLRRQRREPVCQSQGRLGGLIAEVRVGRQGHHLRCCCLGKLLAAMAHAVEPQGSRCVDELPAITRANPGSVPGHHHQLMAIDR